MLHLTGHNFGWYAVYHYLPVAVHSGTTSAVLIVSVAVVNKFGCCHVYDVWSYQCMVFCGCCANAMYCLHPTIKYLDTYHIYGDLI